MKYGIYNTRAKAFQFGIVEPSKNKAREKLFKKIGKDAYRWRFTVRKINDNQEENKMDFSKFDSAINSAEMEKQIKEAKENQPTGEGLETPAGSYVTKVEKMELAATKDGRPMFKVQLRVIEAGENAKDDVVEYLSHFKNKKPCLFMNRVIYGTKNDANMIASVIGWLEKLEPAQEVVFKNYSQFADLILDIYEDVAGAIELDVDYDPNAFNSISINEIYDI